MKIYTFPSFVSLKPVIAAEEMGMQYELVNLDASKGEHKQPTHIQRHPLGKTPALELDGKYLFESNAICRFLATSQRSSLYPEGAWERAQIDQWIDYVTLHAGKSLSTVMYEEYLFPKIYGKPTNQALVDEAKALLPDQLKVLEDALGRSSYLGGNQFTIADIVLFSHVATTELSSIKLDDFPRILRWYQGVKDRQPVRQAMQKLNMV